MSKKNKQKMQAQRAAKIGLKRNKRAKMVAKKLLAKKKALIEFRKAMEKKQKEYINELLKSRGLV